MTRANVSAGMQTALAAQTVRPVYLVEIENSGATLYFSTADNSDRTGLTWGGNLYAANNQLYFIPTIAETSDLRAVSCDVVLNGASAAMVAMALEMKHGMAVSINLGLFDASWALIADPILMFNGLFDSATISDQPNPGITLSYESPLLKMNRPGTFRYTDAVQQHLFPGDKGFQYAPLLEDWQGFWGRSARIRTLKKKKERS